MTTALWIAIVAQVLAADKPRLKPAKTFRPRRSRLPEPVAPY